MSSCRYIFSADGKYLLGGMMVGETSDYVKMVALVKKKVRDVPLRVLLLSLTFSFRNHSKFYRLSLSLDLTRAETIQARTWTTILRSVVAT